MTSAPPCSTGLSPSALTVDETATIATLAVTAAPTCTWTATSSVAFITISAGSTTGPGSVNVSIAANPGPPRSGTVVIGNQTLTVNQRQACGYTVSATTVTIPAAGLNTTVSVSTAAGCAWNATSNSSFITLLSAAANTGSGAATFSVAPNAGASRAGTLTIAGHTISVVQSGTPVVSACVTQLCGKFNPPSSTCLAFSNPISGSGGTWDILLSAPATCSWYLATDSWLTADPPVGTGDATVHLRADPSPSPTARSSVVSAGSVSFTVNQNQCAISVSPSSVNVAVEGATVTLAVSTICASWSVRGNDYPYITVLDGATGSGNGTVTFSVAPNTGAARTAVFGVDFTAVTVRQAGS